VERAAAAYSRGTSHRRDGRPSPRTIGSAYYSAGQTGRTDEHAYVANVDGAVVRDGEYLLIERAEDEPHAGGTLAFPGGKVEQPAGGGDPIEETARGELAEEVGIEVGEVAYVLSSTFESDGGTRCLNVVTLCEHEAGEPFPREPEEVASVHWLTAAEIRASDPPAFLERYVGEIEEYRRSEGTGGAAPPE